MQENITGYFAGKGREQCRERKKIMTGFKEQRGENNFSPGTIEVAPYISSELPECKSYRVFSAERIRERKVMEKKGEGNLILLPLKLVIRLYLSNRILLNTQPRRDDRAKEGQALPSGNLQSNEDLTPST